MRIEIAVKSILLLLLAALAVQSIAGCSSAHSDRGLSEPTPANLNNGSAGALRMPVRPEIWVIEQSAEGAMTTSSSELFRPGITEAQTSELLPLLHCEVKATVNGFISCTNITQHFNNTIRHNFDAIYTFRLPTGACVNDFIMSIGQREVRAIIRPRADAENIYRKALEQGYTASLIAQSNGGLFSQKISNLPADVPVDVNIKYFNTLSFRDGWFAYTFPLHDWAKTTTPGAAVPIEIQLKSPTPIGDIRSDTDSISLHRASNESARITLGQEPRHTRGDFILQFRPAEKGPVSSFLTERSGKGGYFALMLSPPREGRVNDVTINWNGVQVSDVLMEAPNAIGPRPTLLAGRYTGAMPDEVSVSGIFQNKPCNWTLKNCPVDPIDHASPGIEWLWAQFKISSLCERCIKTSDPALLEQIRQIALDHSIVSPLTALLMIDATGPVNNPQNK